MDDDRKIPTDGTEAGLDAGADGMTETYTRREALAAVRRYSALVVGTSAVILTADEVLAGPKPCSQFKGKGPKRCR